MMKKRANHVASCYKHLVSACAQSTTAGLASKTIKINKVAHLKTCTQIEIFSKCSSFCTMHEGKRNKASLMLPLQHKHKLLLKVISFRNRYLMEQSHQESSQAQTLVFGFELEWSQSWGITPTPHPKFFPLTLALQNSTSHLCVCVSFSSLQIQLTTSCH
jgi:hypothetical protein